MQSEKSNSNDPIKFIAHRRESDKACQSLEDHLIGVSSLSGDYAKEIKMQKCGELIGILHDMGKASQDFYTYICSATGLISPDEDEYVDFDKLKGKIDHSSAGAQYLYKMMAEQGSQAATLSQLLTLPLFSHHSGLVDCITPQGEDNYTRKIKKTEELTHSNESWENLNTELKENIEKKLNKASIEIIMDELNEKMKEIGEAIDTPSEIYFKAGLLVRMLFSCLIDADRLDTADFEFPENKLIRDNGKYISWSTLSERLEGYISDLPARNNIDALRCEVSNECLVSAKKPKGLYQLKVPTGGGKTLSSMRFAINHALEHEGKSTEGFKRVIYIIPYTSIIEQNADVARLAIESDLLGNRDSLPGIILEHHSNLSPEKETRRQYLLSENWDARIVFTTMVQFLESAFGGGTRNTRRMHQLANSVIIFDEIQTLPIRCVYMFNLAVRFLVRSCGATVVLCTATQPLLNEVEPRRAIAQGSISDLLSSELSKKLECLTKRYEVYDFTRPHGYDNSEISVFVQAEIDITGSVLVVVNKKNSAKQLYETIKKSTDVSLYHLSTSMCPKHRTEILNKVKARLKNHEPVVCISTQLIEAGVDIDFGSVIRYCAGLDSIAQAAGRCNRNGLRITLGRVLIVNPNEEILKQLKDIEVGKQFTERILYEYKNDNEIFPDGLLSSEAIRNYYLYYFNNRETEMSYHVTSKSSVGREDNLYELLSKNELSCNAYRRVKGVDKIPVMLKQSFKVAADEFEAIDSHTQGIIVPYGEEGKQLITDLCSSAKSPKIFKLLKEAQRYSVNVFSHEFKRLLSGEVIHEIYEGSGVYYIDREYYDDQFGWSLEAVKPMDTLFL